MKYIFTFSRITPEQYEIYQVIARDEISALGWINSPIGIHLDSCLPTYDGLQNGIVFSHIWENESNNG